MFAPETLTAVWSCPSSQNLAISWNWSLAETHWHLRKEAQNNTLQGAGSGATRPLPSFSRAGTPVLVRRHGILQIRYSRNNGAGHWVTKDYYGAKSIQDFSEIEAQMLYSTEKHRRSVGLSQGFY